MFHSTQRLDSKKGKPLDQLLLGAVALSLTAAGLSMGYSHFHFLRIQADAEADSGGYKVGELFGRPELLSTTIDLSLVVWIDSRCGACQKSGGFYSRLASISTAVHLVIAAPGPRVQLDSYLDQYAIGIASRFTFDDQTDLQSLGRVPSLSLVGKDRVVKKRWRGLLTPEQEREVFSTIAGERKGLPLIH